MTDFSPIDSADSTIVRIGFLPLLDSALLIIAKEKGFFTRNGLRVELRKANSWFHLCDMLLESHLDAAHTLLTIPIQLALRQGRGERLCYAYTLNSRGNGIVVSNGLWNAGVKDQEGLAKFYQSNPHHPMRFGIVFPQGTQEYFLRYWLNGASQELGAHPNLAIVPPQELVGRLRKGDLDGFCVAEPWIGRATDSKLGRVVARSGDHLPGLGDKVLAVRESWHIQHPGAHESMLRAIHEAAIWLTNPDHHSEAMAYLSAKRYVNTTHQVIQESLAHGTDESHKQLSNEAILQLHTPQKSHIEWYLEQMLKWNHVTTSQIVMLDFNRICLAHLYHKALG